MTYEPPDRCFLIAVAAICPPMSARQLAQPDPPCHATVANQIIAGSTKRSPGSHGNALLTAHGVYGTLGLKLGGASVTQDWPLRLKFGWTRAVRGDVTVTGRRLDGDAPPLQADFKCCYGKVDFQSSYLIFPTPGCWEVAAQIGEIAESRLTFVTKVVKISEDPVWLSPLKN